MNESITHIVYFMGEADEMVCMKNKDWNGNNQYNILLHTACILDAFDYRSVLRIN